jgi:predicted nucleic acid-binding protein
MPEQEVRYFFDAVVLSNFALSDSTHLLVKRYGKRTVLTSEVLDEIAQGIAAGYESLRTIVASVTEERFSSTVLRKEERDQYTGLLKTLGSGEASAIVCAKARGGIAVTDDKAARKCAADNGVPFTGTLGILKRLAVDKRITPEAADDILADMIHHGFYSPVKKISELL